jgi:hypothetical protein
VSVLVAILIGLLSKSYYLVVAVKGSTDPMAAMQMTLQWIVPLLGLWVWLFLRTFVWIPVIGVILAIVLGPRFVLAPLYVLDRSMGVTESARESYAKTKGYWGKIFGNAFVVALAVMICTGIVSKILSSILGMTLGGFAGAMLMSLASGFMVVFTIALARTVMENPRMA